jgi:putative Holliday junction resolvase
MVVMTMGDQDVRRPRRRGLRIGFEAGIAGEERVDEDDGRADVEAKGRMAEPGELHAQHSEAGIGAHYGANRGRSNSPAARPMIDFRTPLADLAAGLPARARLLGLDLGTKTIGVAVSDVERRIASPLETIRRTKFSADAARLVEIVAAQQAAALVLGLPLNMDGTEGPRCQATRAFARNLAPMIAAPILFWDERLSTAAVTRSLIAQDASRAKRANVVDRMAAAYILQGALDLARSAAK